MKLLVEIKDDKADFIIELLGNFKYVKTKPITASKAQALEGIREALEQVNLSKKGKIKLKSARSLLNEL